MTSQIPNVQCRASLPRSKSVLINLTQFQCFLKLFVLQFHDTGSLFDWQVEYFNNDFREGGKKVSKSENEKSQFKRRIKKNI